MAAMGALLAIAGNPAWGGARQQQRLIAHVGGVMMFRVNAHGPCNVAAMSARDKVNLDAFTKKPYRKRQRYRRFPRSAGGQIANTYYRDRRAIGV